MVVISTTMFAQRTTIYPTLSANVIIDDPASSSFDYYLVGQVVTSNQGVYGLYPSMYNPYTTAGIVYFYNNSQAVEVPKPNPLSMDFYAIRVICIRVYAGTTTEYDRQNNSVRAILDSNDNLYASEDIQIKF